MSVNALSVSSVLHWGSQLSHKKRFGNLHLSVTIYSSLEILKVVRSKFYCLLFIYIGFIEFILTFTVLYCPYRF